MFQFRRFPAYAYLIQRTLTEYCSAGFPHSEICGSKLICSSPQLIAACHVLLRLLMPRHSPCALSSLTFVVAKSALLRFRLTAKTAHAPLLLLSKSNPLRWALILWGTGNFASFASTLVIRKVQYLRYWFSNQNYAGSSKRSFIWLIVITLN